MTRLRELGVNPGRLPTGENNAITDVPGVRVGHTTLIADDPPQRTGVTVIIPHSDNVFQNKVPAAVHTINGFGKAAGFEQVRELGNIESPIALTNTLNVSLVADALIGKVLENNPEIGLKTREGTLNVVVGECNDGYLSDIRGRHVKQEHVRAALDSATGGAVVEGAVGAGTGTACFQFKGGIGTASRRVLDGRYSVGALVQSNFGLREELMVMGVPVGLHLRETGLPGTPPGSIMMVLATDAPFSANDLRRLAVRASFGLARTGSMGAHGSGDFVIAFSTGYTIPHKTDDVVMSARTIHSRHIDAFFQAVVDSVEEAIYNSMTAAHTVTGRDGHTLHALPLDVLRDLLEQYGRLS